MFVTFSIRLYNPWRSLGGYSVFYRIKTTCTTDRAHIHLYIHACSRALTFAHAPLPTHANKLTYSHTRFLVHCLFALLFTFYQIHFFPLIRSELLISSTSHLSFPFFLSPFLSSFPALSLLLFFLSLVFHPLVPKGLIDFFNCLFHSFSLNILILQFFCFTFMHNQLRFFPFRMSCLRSTTMTLQKSWCQQTIQQVEEISILCTTPFQHGLR